MGNQESIDSNRLLTYRSLWRLSREGLDLFCARYGVSEEDRRILLNPQPEPALLPTTKTLMLVVLAKD
jgi:hypothetical protein